MSEITYPKENGITISGEPESLGKALYRILIPKSNKWEEAQEYIFKQNEEREG